MLDGGREDCKPVSRVCVSLCMRNVKLSECMLVFFKNQSRHVAVLFSVVLYAGSNFYLTYDTYLMI